MAEAQVAAAEAQVAVAEAQVVAAEAQAASAEAQVAAAVCRPEELDDSSSVVAATGVFRKCRLPEILAKAIAAI